MPSLVLASQSPRRIELLKLFNIPCQVVPSNIEEKSAESGAKAVMDIAKAKALDVANKIAKNSDTIILAADTVVVIDNKVLGKPNSKQEAFDMLNSLSGRSHEVYTGLAIIKTENNHLENDFAVSKVYFRELNQKEIKAYIETKEPFDKAGAYALQGMASCFVEKVDGCYTNIIGLPMPLTIKMLRHSGMKILDLP